MSYTPVRDKSALDASYRVDRQEDGSWIMDAPLSVIREVLSLHNEAVNRIIGNRSEPTTLSAPKSSICKGQMVTVFPIAET